MTHSPLARSGLWLIAAALIASCSQQQSQQASSNTTTLAQATSAEPAAVNIYKGSTADKLSPAVAGALERIYVPDVGDGDLYVIDPQAMKVIDKYHVGLQPQHVVPSWDLKSLWVTGSTEHGSEPGALTEIDPKTAKVVQSIPVDDAYNMYFTPNGDAAVVVAEARKRLEYRDPHTMAKLGSLATPDCAGVNHADYAPDGSYAIFTCEFVGGLIKVDVKNRKVLGFLKLAQGGMPQDIRSSPDGKVFYVANMMTDGVHLIDGDAFKEIGFIPTGVGAHGIYPSRDGTKLYVSNRGSHEVGGKPKGPGSVSVIDFATRTVEKTWPIPGGGSPDMGNVTADGKHLWLSGRFDNEVYRIDTTTGAVDKIAVGRNPHGLAVWPQPGAYSLGHTGVMR